MKSAFSNPKSKKSFPTFRRDFAALRNPKFQNRNPKSKNSSIEKLVNKEIPPQQMSGQAVALSGSVGMTSLIFHFPASTISSILNPKSSIEKFVPNVKSGLRYATQSNNS